MPPPRVNEPTPKRKVNLEQELAQMLTSHTAFMNETKVKFANPDHPIKQSDITIEKLRGANGPTGQFVDREAEGSITK